MSIRLDQPELLNILNDKKNAVIDWLIPNKLENDLRKVSEFNFLVREYLYFLNTVLQIPVFEDFGKRFNRNYPYIAWLEIFLEDTDCEKKNNSRFDGFKGFRFIRDMRKEIRINPESELGNHIRNAKNNVKRSYEAIYHYFKISPNRDLNYTPLVRGKIKWIKGNNFFDVSEDERFFRLKNKKYKFARNAKNIQKIAKELLENGEINITKLNKIVPTSKGCNEKRLYKQFIASISNSSNYSKEEIAEIFQFDEKSKRFFIKKPTK